MAVIVSVGTILAHGLVIVATGMTDNLLVMMVLGNAVFAGFYLAVPIISLPLIQSHVEYHLGHQKAALSDARRALCGNSWVYVVMMVSGCIGVLLLYSSQVSALYGFQFFSSTSFELGVPNIAFLYLILPVQGITFGVALGAIVVVIRYLWRVAGKVSIDVYRLEDYSCVSSVMVLTFVLLSSMLSVLGIFALFLPFPEEIVTRFSSLFTWVAGSGLLFVLVTGLPVLKLRNRIEPVLFSETRQARQHASGGSNSAALVQLMYLESRSSWPFGTRLRRMIVFGILPPAAWVLAAIIENTLYS